MKAKPIGASLRSGASSAESDTSRPETRGRGTEVPVLTASTPHSADGQPSNSSFLLTADTRRLLAITQEGRHIPATSSQPSATEPDKAAGPVAGARTFRVVHLPSSYAMSGIIVV